MAFSLGDVVDVERQCVVAKFIDDDCNELYPDDHVVRSIVVALPRTHDDPDGYDPFYTVRPERPIDCADCARTRNSHNGVMYAGPSQMRLVSAVTLLGEIET